MTTEIVVAPRVTTSHKPTEIVATQPHREPWERQSYDTRKSWLAFKTYRDLGEDRTHALTSKMLGRPPGYIRALERWSAADHWVARALAWDDRQDAIARQALERKALRLADRRMTVAGKMLEAAERTFDSVNQAAEGEEPTVLGPALAATVAERASKVGDVLKGQQSSGPVVRVEDLLAQAAARSRSGQLTD